MEQLRRLDKSATKKGTALSIVVGVAGCLLMGVGMCCSMVWMGNLFIPGIVLGLLGIALVAAAHPVYQRVTKKEREKLAPRILQLTEELALRNVLQPMRKPLLRQLPFSSTWALPFRLLADPATATRRRSEKRERKARPVQRSS